MDNSQAPSSILDTLRTVEFRLGLKGYNVDEVDEYLDKAAQEAEALQEHVRQLNERLRQASERIAQLERDKRAAPVAAESEESVAAAAAAAATAEANALSDETLQRTLLLAQKFVDQTKRESEAEAAAVVAQAEETARASIAAAEATAAQLQAETHQKLRDEVARLEATRTELATDVESMARHLESERNRLRGGAVRDPQVGGRERAAGELAHGREAEGRPGDPARRGSGQAAGAGRRCADPEPGERIHLGSARVPLIHPSGPVGACCPCPSRSGIVTRSPGEVVFGETGHMTWSEGGNDDPSEQRCPGQAGTSVATGARHCLTRREQKDLGEG